MPPRGRISLGIRKELHAGYLVLNIAGSLLLGVVAIVDGRAGSILLEFAWAGIALFGVMRLVRMRGMPPPS